MMKEQAHIGMNNEAELLQYICEREMACKVYDIRLGGIAVYDFVRQNLRAQYLRAYGVKCMNLTGAINGRVLLSVVISVFHILKLILTSAKVPFLFLAFPRTDRIGTDYCDKFTDPFIDYGNIADEDYMIFEAGRGGRHNKPRMHAEHIVYIDAMTVWVRLATEFRLFFGTRRYKKIVSCLFDTISGVCGVELMNKKQVARLVIGGEIGVRSYKFLMKRLGVRKVFSPVRPVCEFMAARLLGAECYEMQHGITYGESVLYSGYRDPMIVPNYFLAFGDNRPKSVYGIEESKILNVGWPFGAYLRKESAKNPTHANDILVISDPEISDIMIGVVLELAAANQSINFYLRPHPQEVYTQEQLNRLQRSSNILVQDNQINIGVAIQSFDNVIGENSTALYEALAVNKKVGKLFWHGLNPIYLHEDDRELFWEIHSLSDFDDFLKGQNTDKKTRSIYSEFDKVLFDSLLI